MREGDTGVAALRRHAHERLAARDWPAAIAACRRLLGQEPADADGWFNLGYALRHAGEFEAAIEAYGQALRHGVADPAMAHVNRAAIHADHLRRDDAAEAELRRALELSPAHPHALLNLGNLYEERGRRDEAIAAYLQLLERGDGDAAAAEALARLASLQPPVNAGDPLLDRLRRAAVDVRVPAALRANLCFARGRALDALGDATAAFAAFGAGKVLAHAGHPVYDPHAAEARTRLLIDAFPRPARHRPVQPQPAPVFICGMFRSGSTLLEQVLAAHPDIAAAGELDLLPRMAATALAPFPAAIADLDDDRRDALAAGYHRALMARLPPRAAACRMVTDKRPDNVLLVGLAKQLFPQARIIHTVRDPRDIALSVLMQHLNPRAFPWAADLQSIGHHVLQQRELVTHWRTLYPDDVLEFDYDAFIAAPEPVLRVLLDRLGLPWHAGCLQFHELGNTVKTASAWQVRKPLYADASGRWRRYRDQLRPLEAMLRAAGMELPDDATDQGSPALR
ncbi:tetratricopeptide repeat protein [Luteimonas yindakuii]|uniref:Tetratricopeptide repeat protein n=1 Tax=Luteimonas yindakuii TaxID=2565782 RepID=A0A4Z1R621_9GAMM|nr:sulfotransferase [Luteimonas yindakuii]TKS54900.1 tetratricopeptide repeat protein [Luteimonas yindakuii]